MISSLVILLLNPKQIHAKDRSLLLKETKHFEKPSEKRRLAVVGLTVRGLHRLDRLQERSRRG